MNVYFLFPWCRTPLPFDFLSVLVVRGGAVCLPMLPSWFSPHEFVNSYFLSTYCLSGLNCAFCFIVFTSPSHVLRWDDDYQYPYLTTEDTEAGCESCTQGHEQVRCRARVEGLHGQEMWLLVPRPGQFWTSQDGWLPWLGSRTLISHESVQQCTPFPRHVLCCVLDKRS